MSNRYPADQSQRYALAAIKDREPDSLRAYVVSEALAADYDIKLWFRDLIQNGCISGMVSSLIYYTDTYAFFDAHYEAIQDLMHEYDWHGVSAAHLLAGSDLKNILAWWAFETTAYDLAIELDLISGQVFASR